MTEQQDLQPCPFCGERDPRVDNWRTKDRGPERWRVSCDDGCGAEITASSPEKVIRMWNRRSAPVETPR